MKVYVNHAPSIGNKSAKFYLNLPKQAIVTAAFVKSPQSTLVCPCVWRHPQTPETEVFYGDFLKAAVGLTIVKVGRYTYNVAF